MEKHADARTEKSRLARRLDPCPDEFEYDLAAAAVAWNCAPHVAIPDEVRARIKREVERSLGRSGSGGSRGSPRGGSH